MTRASESGRRALLRRAILAAAGQRPGWRLASWIGMLVLLGFAPSYALDSGNHLGRRSAAEYGNRVLAGFRRGSAIARVRVPRSVLVAAGCRPAAAGDRLEAAPAWGTVRVAPVSPRSWPCSACLPPRAPPLRIAGPRGLPRGGRDLLTPCWVGTACSTEGHPFGAAAAFVAHAMVCIVMRRARSAERRAALRVAVGAASACARAGCSCWRTQSWRPATLAWRMCSCAPAARAAADPEPQPDLARWIAASLPRHGADDSARGWAQVIHWRARSRRPDRCAFHWNTGPVRRPLRDVDRAAGATCQTWFAISLRLAYTCSRGLWQRSIRAPRREPARSIWVARWPS